MKTNVRMLDFPPKEEGHYLVESRIENFDDLVTIVARIYKASNGKRYVMTGPLYNPEGKYISWTPKEFARKHPNVKWTKFNIEMDTKIKKDNSLGLKNVHDIDVYDLADEFNHVLRAIRHITQEYPNRNIVSDTLRSELKSLVIRKNTIVKRMGAVDLENGSSECAVRKYHFKNTDKMTPEELRDEFFRVVRELDLVLDFGNLVERDYVDTLRTHLNKLTEQIKCYVLDWTDSYSYATDYLGSLLENTPGIQRTADGYICNRTNHTSVNVLVNLLIYVVQNMALIALDKKCDAEFKPSEGFLNRKYDPFKGEKVVSHQLFDSVDSDCDFSYTEKTYPSKLINQELVEEYYTLVNMPFEEHVQTCKKHLYVKDKHLEKQYKHFVRVGAEIIRRNLGKQDSPKNGVPRLTLFK